MWTSDRGRKRPAQEPLADVGQVTVADEQLGVYLEGERRWVRLYGPGGYSWRPAPGEQVLVLKAGGEGEIPCVVGSRQQQQLKPGEVAISSGDGKASVRLCRGGTLKLNGSVEVQGKPLEDMIEEIVHKLGY